MPIECTTPRMNPSVDHGLWVILMYQSQLILGLKRKHPLVTYTDVDNQGGYECIGHLAYGKSLCLALNFCCKPEKNPGEIKSCK